MLKIRVILKNGETYFIRNLNKEQASNAVSSLVDNSLHCTNFISGDYKLYIPKDNISLIAVEVA